MLGGWFLAFPAEAGIFEPVTLGSRLAFPKDLGSHPGFRTEWWYVTGWLCAADKVPTRPAFGFQVTFFRTRTGLAEDSASRFAPRQLVFAHVALTDLAAGARGGGLLHDQRIARVGLGLARTPDADGDQIVQLRDWRLSRDASAAGTSNAPAPLHVDVRSERFAFELMLRDTSPVLLQGEAGYSQKGPEPRQASHYYSEVQLDVRGRLRRPGADDLAVTGRAWLDHEWSNELLPPEAVGWDWLGINLLDGSALMAFRLRRADGSTVWAGGSFRGIDLQVHNFAAADVRLEPRRRWTSPRTQAVYPIAWTIATPLGDWQLEALQDDQELDSRGSTGSVYWEGLSTLKDSAGRTVGYGYLEMTGYAGKLRL